MPSGSFFAFLGAMALPVFLFLNQGNDEKGSSLWEKIFGIAEKVVTAPGDLLNYAVMLPSNLDEAAGSWTIDVPKDFLITNPDPGIKTTKVSPFGYLPVVFGGSDLFSSFQQNYWNEQYNLAVAQAEWMNSPEGQAWLEENN